MGLAKSTTQKASQPAKPTRWETVFGYDPTDTDLLRIKQKNGSTYDPIETRTYDGQHLPLTVTNAAGL